MVVVQHSVACIVGWRVSIFKALEQILRFGAMTLSCPRVVPHASVMGCVSYPYDVVMGVCRTPYDTAMPPPPLLILSDNSNTGVLCIAGAT